jgi:hypothetical protein
VDAVDESGNAAGWADASHRAGHQNMRGPIGDLGRQAHAHRPTPIPTVIVAAKYAARASIVSWAALPATYVTTRASAKAAASHHAAVRMPSLQRLMCRG